MIDIKKLELDHYKELFLTWYSSIWTEKWYWKSAVVPDKFKEYIDCASFNGIFHENGIKCRHLEMGCGPIPRVESEFVSLQETECIFSDALIPFYEQIWKSFEEKMPSNFKFCICEFADSFFERKYLIQLQ